ncbi:MAG: RNA degradosome polyphosphate kinase, partial [Clostridiaceae bacterium]
MEKCYSKNNFINRELSWLEFNERVLQEAQDTNNPLLERLKFVAIVSSNLDEFFMIRVGSLYDQIDAGFEKEEPSGLTPKQQIAKISVRTHEMINDLSNCYNRSIKISMKRNKIIILREEELEKEQKEYIDRYYEKNIFPVLTPIVVDKSSPFPLVLNKSLNIALLIQDKTSKEKMFGTIQVPSVLERLVEIPNAKEGNTFILLEDIIKRNL